MLNEGRAALVTTKANPVDMATGASLATTVQKLYMGGQGGFGGPRGTSAPWAVPDSAPDHVLECRTARCQALFYRLTGDRKPCTSGATALPGSSALCGALTSSSTVESSN